MSFVLQKKATAKDIKSNDKWSYSIIAGLLFLVLSLPCVADMISPLSQAIGGSKNEKTVNLIILTTLYVLIIRMFMW